MPRLPQLITGLLITVGVMFVCPVFAAEQPCARPGTWHSPKTGQEMSTSEVMDGLGSASIILLGERHDSSTHHRWQLHVLSALHGRDSLASVGLEMFPRSSQTAVNDWISGKLTKDEFLSNSRWHEVWGYNPELYMPLFHFVRMHQIPTRAINVDRDTVRMVREKGLANLSNSALEGVSKPAEPSDSYKQDLAEVLKDHPGDIDLEHFIASQTFWDRAMAEGLKQAQAEHGSPVVGIVGMGHARYGRGIPHQLRALGMEDVVVLLPHKAGQACPEDNRADYLFTVPSSPAGQQPEPPRMGIAYEFQDGKRVSIIEVLKDSPAADAGIKAGDQIIQAAGEKLTHPGSLKTAVRQQPPGTWLPLLIERDGKRQQVIVKFPPER